MHRFQVRFGLRALFAIVTLAAATCYWAATPTILAERFVASLRRLDIEGADRLMRADEGCRIAMSELSVDQVDSAEIRITPLTMWQLIRGERYIQARVPRSEDGSRYSWYLVFLVTRRGVIAQMAVH
jgi:hypothetical protein